MAAKDFAEFQWKKFLRSLLEAESELSGSINLISYFKTIKQKLIETETIPFSEIAAGMALNMVSWERNTYILVYRYLLELNYALAECRIFAKEFKELNKKILPLNPSTVYFILKMKKRLTALSSKFDILVRSSPSTSVSVLREKKERNAVECVGFTEKDIVVIKKNSEETVVFSDVRFGRQYSGSLTLRDFHLLSDGATGNGFTSIGIVGMAGVGKSTFLLKEILEWNDIRSEFSPIIQLCLSDIMQENNVVGGTSANGVSMSIVKLILQKLGEEETGISGLGLTSLLERLYSLLSGKKYLIALDDVFNAMEFYSDLGNDRGKFGNRLSHGLPKDSGGVVIVISSKPEVALDMVGLRQNSVHKRLTTLKRKSGVRSTTSVERQDHQTPIDNSPTSISTPKEKTNVVEECLPLTEKAKKISPENVLLIPNVGRSRNQRDFRDSSLLVGDPAGIGFTAIGIVGMAGVGKSTFVHKVLKTVWFEFDPIVWLCLSDIIKAKNQVPDATAATDQEISISIVTCILEMLGVSIDKNLSLAELLERLYHVLLGKRYLIVLDDVWDIMEFYSDLCFKLPEGEKIQDHLSHGLPKDSGGTVIVTTRLTEVARDMVGFGQNKLFLVLPLEREECFSNFNSFLHHEKYRCGEGTRFGKSNMETVKKVHDEILHQVCGLPSIAKTLADLIIANQIGQNDYNRSALKKMLIPHEIRIQCSWVTVATKDKKAKWIQDKTEVPKCPIFVFIDLRSDQVGDLAEDLRYLLNREQVIAVLHESFHNKYKLSTVNPDRALTEVYGALATLKGVGHNFTDEIQKKMTIIIVGEDVFINWFLGVFCDLNLPDSPSIVPIALGIKSNIPFSFGWEFDAMKPVNKILETVLNHTKQIKADSWRILINLKAIPTDNQELPYCLHLCTPVDEPDRENVDNRPLIRGEFWNYFSIGVDDPRLYGASRFRHTSRTLNRLLAKVEVLKHHGDQWEMLSIPSSIRSIVCLNLPSFVGGLTPWTTANLKKDHRKGLTSSFTDDGRLEIIGSRDDLLSPKKRWIRLDQVREIRFKFIEESAEVVNMMIDGVPLKKSPLDGLDEIEISYCRQVSVLVEQGYSAKSIHDS
ncbi:uncharacterized protein LOC112185567 isoform X1 [Rosa chinensis]|nr:uncharacterized protein LOC112185567 isoform X1 [Rosa chinensis]